MNRNYRNYEVSNFAIRCRCYKWAMIAHKGGKCADCSETVTSARFEDFEFDHKIRINNRNDLTGRWTGDVRNWPPFTDKWFAWAESVDLVCSKCHHRRHFVKKQIDFDFEIIQRRLDAVGDGPHPTIQMDLLDEDAA